MFELDLLLLALSSGLLLHLLGDNVTLFQATKHLIVSFHDALLVRISVTSQYNNIYEVIEQLVTLAFPFVCL